jgi:cyanuric acid amidohydrolase
MSVTLVSFDMSSPEDLSVLSAHLESLDIGRLRRLALMLRVAGEYEDGSREKARAAIEDMLLRFSLTNRSAFITVVGAEGASTPCGFALIDQESDAPVTGEPGLALGVRLEAPPPEPTIGGVSFAHDVASMVAAAIEDSGMDRAEIQLVIVNVPMATSGQAALRSRQGRAAAALGAGVALGEIDPAAVTAERILTDASLFTPRVQTFTGPAIRQIEIILIGNSNAAGGDLFAVNTVTQDLLDTRSIRRMMMEAGLQIDADGELDTDHCSQPWRNMALARMEPSMALPRRFVQAPCRLKNMCAPRFRACWAQRFTPRGSSAHSIRSIRRRPVGERSAASFGNASLGAICRTSDQPTAHVRARFARLCHAYWQC